MPENSEKRRGENAVLRWIARAILILWAGFWLYFNIGSAFAEEGGLASGALSGHMLVALLILLAALTAWFFEGPGGLLLIVLALAACFLFRIPAQLDSPNGWMLLLTLVLPAGLAGVLFTVNHWARRKPPASSQPAGVQHE